MPLQIENPAESEICAVIRFLSAKSVKAVEIRRQILEMYGQNIMSDGKVRKWVEAFKGGRNNVHGEERIGGPSLTAH